MRPCANFKRPCRNAASCGERALSGGSRHFVAALMQNQASPILSASLCNDRAVAKVNKLSASSVSEAQTAAMSKEVGVSIFRPLSEVLGKGATIQFLSRGELR